MEFPKGRGTQLEKSWQFQAPRNEKSCKVEDQTGPSSLVGVWIFSGTTH